MAHTSNPRVLFSPSVARNHKDLLLQNGKNAHNLIALGEPADVTGALEGGHYEVLVLGPSDCADVEEMKRRTDFPGRKNTDLIFLTDHEDAEGAVRMMKAGAVDVLVAPVDADRLMNAIMATLAKRVQATILTAPSDPVEQLVGSSLEIRALHKTINTVARSDAAILLNGESGTGKELVARALHARSNRCVHPFIAVNCAALPRDILENELFGHEKGAFTGALDQKPGCFEMANHGTLFLDEIGEMTTETQAKLLRVIEDQRFRRLGGREEIRVNVRIIAATNRTLSGDSGALRPDLYYRLSVVEIELPPLRNRSGDIPELAQYFLNFFCMKYGKNIEGFAKDYLEFLERYSWPGNVRELRNSIERAVVICQGTTITSTDLPSRITNTQRELMHINIPIGSTVEEAEKKLILETLASVGNNKAKAARILGVSRKTLHNKLNSFRWDADNE